MAELAASIVLHTLLGVVLGVALWLVGAGCVRVARGRARPSPADALDAYPLGLLAITAGSAAVLLDGRLALVVAPALVALAATGARGLLEYGALARAFAPVVALGVALGLIWHGPTRNVPSHAFGDMLYYVGKLVSATQSIVPFRELLAEGQRLVYVEAAPSFVGAVLSHLPGFDPVLVHAASFPAAMLAAVAVGFGIAARRRGRAVSLLDAVPLALLAVAMVAYPSWITESPPVALALPVVFSVYGLWAEPRAARWTVLVGGVIALDLLLTKVLGIVPVAVVAVAILYARVAAGRPLRAVLVRVALPVALSVAAGISLLFAFAGWYAELYEPKFLPLDAARGLERQLEVRDTHAAAPAFTVAAQLLLLVALWRARAFAFAGALAAAVAGDWLGGAYGFDVSIGVAVLLAVLLFADAPERLRTVRLPLAGAAAAFALASWFRELAGIRGGLVVVALTALAVLTALVRLRPRAALALAATIAAAFAAGAATGFHLTTGTTLGRDDYEIWRKVEEVVPRDALVFTSQTGRAIDDRNGWNNYPSISGRQLYLAGWYDTELRAKPEELERRLALNGRVVRGELAPAQLELERDHSSFWAVLWREATPPPTFRRVYANGTFALYAIES